jgi:aldehyde dehydrogenase (NAD+)
MEAASKHLTPVVLELGGKSPVVVDETANISEAARRIIWGKTINAGQTCVAPDYLFVHKSVKTELLREMKRAIHEFFGEHVENSPDYARIVNEKHYDALKNKIEREKKNIYAGGRMSKKNLYIEPTLVEVKDLTSPLMQEENFGPVLPVLSYENLEDALTQIDTLPHPLALYVFSKNTRVQNEILARVPSGDASINDTITHFVNSNLPFGGIKSSGLGNYHGKYSFETFSHARGVLKKNANFNLPIIFPPYSDKTLKLIRHFLK